MPSITSHGRGKDWPCSRRECSMPEDTGMEMGTRDITIHLCRSDEFIPMKKEHLGDFVSLAMMTKDSGGLSHRYRPNLSPKDFSHWQSINDYNDNMGNVKDNTLFQHSPHTARVQCSNMIRPLHIQWQDPASDLNSHPGCLEVPKLPNCASAAMDQDHIVRVSENPASMINQRLVCKTPPLSPSSLNLHPRSNSPRPRFSSTFKPGKLNNGACKARNMGGNKKAANTGAEVKSKKCPADSAKSRKVQSKVKPRRMNRPEHNHAKSATDVLKHWFASNLSSPFPSEAIKAKLSDDSGLSVAQVSNWFVNHRKRVLKPLRTAAGLPQLRNRLGKEFAAIPVPSRRRCST